MHNDKLQTIIMDGYFIPVCFIHENVHDEVRNLNECGLLFFMCSMYFDMLDTLNKYDSFLINIVGMYNTLFKTDASAMTFFDSLLKNKMENIIKFMKLCVQKQYTYFYVVYEGYKNFKMCLDENDDKYEFYKTRIIDKKNAIDELIVSKGFYLLKNETLIQSYDIYTKMYDYFLNFENIMIEIFKFHSYVKKINVANNLK